MFIDRNKDTSNSYVYNRENGSVIYKSVKNNHLNKWLRKCNDQYEKTYKGENPSLFFVLGVCTAMCWIIIFFAYFNVGGITSITGVYWVLGIFTALSLISVLISERCAFWYIPICTSLLLIVYIKYCAPYFIHSHVEDCETAQKIIQTGKLVDHETCIYENYIINNLNEFKQ